MNPGQEYTEPIKIFVQTERQTERDSQTERERDESGSRIHGHIKIDIPRVPLSY